MLWSEYLDERYGRGVTLAYTGDAFPVDPFIVQPNILENGNGNVGLELIISHGEVELAREREWKLGLLGDPNEPANKADLQRAITRALPMILHEAHLGLRTLMAKTEAHLKTLTEMKAELSSVRLVYEYHAINLTLSLARQILLIKAREEGQVQAKVPEPFRLQVVDPSSAMVYDDRNRLLGHIAFNPTVEAYKTTQGRLGLHNVTQKGGHTVA